MTVNHIWTSRAEMTVTGEGYAPVGRFGTVSAPSPSASSEALRLLLSGAALCSNAKLIPPEEGKERYNRPRRPDRGLPRRCRPEGRAGSDPAWGELPPHHGAPFDSRRKRMTTIHQLREPLDGATRVAFVKGSPKEVMELCGRCYGRLCLPSHH